MGVADVTFYRWKKKFADIGVTELRRLRKLEEEKRKLKQLVVRPFPDKVILQYVSKKTLKSARSRMLCKHLVRRIKK